MAACNVAQNYKTMRRHVGYVGDVKANLPQGYGVCTYRNTFFQYEGEWHEGIKEGIGKLKMNDGGYYEGQFTNGEIDGNGTRYWSHSGNIYVGEFEKGEMCGQGVMTYGNGDVYEGHWLDNMQHGEGILTKADGAIYNGSFYYHKRHGDGKQKYSDGGVYKGGWINHARHGHGVMMFKDGSIYEGQWRADEMHGEGSLTHSSHITYNGLWNNGRPLDEPTSICVLGENEIVLDHNEMSFSIQIECRTAEDVATPECGRSLKARAGIHLVEKLRLTPSRVSCNTTRNDTVASTHKYDENAPAESKRADTAGSVGRRSTPFGFDVDPYPLYTKVMLNDACESTEEVQSTSITPVSVETSVKDGTPTLRTPTTSASRTPPTPIKSFRDAAKIISECRSDSPSQFEYVPVSIQRTVDGKVTFPNLVLPTMDSNHSTSIFSDSPETSEGKSSNKKKGETNKTGDEHSSGNKRKKTIKTKQQSEEKSEEIIPDALYKPGDYVIIIEDVTEDPFLDVILDPIFVQVKVPVQVKKTKSNRGANKTDK